MPPNSRQLSADSDEGTRLKGMTCHCAGERQQVQAYPQRLVRALYVVRAPFDVLPNKLENVLTSVVTIVMQSEVGNIRGAKDGMKLRNF